MVDFCSLPDDIYFIVINKLISSKRCPSETFKNNLFLLKINSRFRHVALPLVYRTSFIIYGKENNQTSGYLVDKPVAEPVQTISTNLELVRQLGIGLTHKLYIGINYLGNPLVGFGKIFELLTDTLPVKEFLLYMRPDLFLARSRRADSNDHVQQVCSIADSFIALLPHVVDLKFEAQSDDMMAQMLYEKIAGGFAGQLQRLNCIYTPKAYFSNLKDAVINVSNEAKFKSPLLNNAILERLVISGVPTDMDWSSLVYDGSLEFPNLHRLHVCYNNTSNPQSEQRYRISLPKLKNLAINCMLNRCPILEQANLPASMDTILIRVGSGIYQSLENIRLPPAKKINLITEGSEGNARTVFHMCQLFDKAQDDQKITLQIYNPAIPVFAENVTCTLVTALLIAAPTSTETLLALLDKLPRLSELKLYHAKFDDAMEVIAATDGPCLPINKQLKDIEIRYRSYECSAEIMTHVLVYLVPRLINLKKLSAAQVPQDMLLEQLMPLQPLYPHIANVNYKLRKPDSSEAPPHRNHDQWYNRFINTVRQHWRRSD